MDAPAQSVLLGLRQRSLDDEPRLDGVPPRLAELVLRQRRDSRYRVAPKKGQ